VDYKRNNITTFICKIIYVYIIQYVYDFYTHSYDTRVKMAIGFFLSVFCNYIYIIILFVNFFYVLFFMIVIFRIIQS